LATHYEKSCPQQLNYHATRGPKQLIYNYFTIIPWKYKELIIKIAMLENQGVVI